MAISACVRVAASSMLFRKMLCWLFSRMSCDALVTGSFVVRLISRCLIVPHEVLAEFSPVLSCYHLLWPGREAHSSTYLYPHSCPLLQQPRIACIQLRNPFL